MDFISKLWLGKFSLPKTYWLFNVLFSILLSIPIKLWDGESVLFPFFYLICVSCYSCVALIGLWRSSNVYLGNQLWVWLSKCVVLIGFATQLIIPFSLAQFGVIYLLSYFLIVIGFLSYIYQTNKDKPTPIKGYSNAIETIEGVNEQHIWTELASEFESNRNEGVWTKCFVESNGDENLAKVRYLKARFDELSKNANGAKEEAVLSNIQPISKSNHKATIAIGALCLLAFLTIAYWFLMPQKTNVSSPYPLSKSEGNATPKWAVWNKEYFEGKLSSVTYVNENSIKKVSLISPIYQVEFANESIKPLIPAHDKVGNEYLVKTMIIKAEYDCKNNTEKVLGYRWFTTPLNGPNQFEVFNSDFDVTIGKTKKIEVIYPSWIGTNSLSRLCSQ